MEDWFSPFPMPNCPFRFHPQDKRSRSPYINREIIILVIKTLWWDPQLKDIGVDEMDTSWGWFWSSIFPIPNCPAWFQPQDINVLSSI